MKHWPVVRFEYVDRFTVLFVLPNQHPRLMAWLHPLQLLLLSNRGSCCLLSVLTHTHHTCTHSTLFGINSHRYWSVQALPLGKVILHLSPPRTSLTPQSHSSVVFTALWGWGGIPLDLSLTACQYRYCQCVIDALGHLCITWKTHIDKPNLSLSLTHTHTHANVYTPTYRHMHTGSIMGNFPLKITCIMALVKILIKGSMWCLLICFIHTSLV